MPRAGGRIVYQWVIWAVMIVGCALASPARAQSSSNGVRIYTQPEGANFYVDGQTFTSAVDFLWPANSKHTISSYDQAQTIPGTKLVYRGWVSNLNSGVGPTTSSQPITADPALQWIKLIFDVSYVLTVQLGDCPDPTQPCLTPGTVNVIGQGLFVHRAQVYIDQNATVEAIASPSSGFVFMGWGAIYGLLAAPTVFDIKFTMVGPTQLTPLFQPANAVQAQVNIQTNPPQLQVMLDRTPYRAPANLEWGWGTVHSLGADPVQVAQGVTYIFDSWSDGGPINHDYTVPSQNGAINLTARFVPAAAVAFQTSPPGLALSIDGRQNWPNYNFAWAPGSTHAISAPATQTDAQGHKYRFVSWSGGQSAAFTYTTGPAPGGDHLVATYQAVGQVTITSIPPGVPVRADAAICNTPCTIEKDAGTAISVAAPSLRNLSDQSRQVFQGWGDSADPARNITVAADARTYTATYTLQNRLSVSATPPEGASFAVNPTSADGFYDAGTLVSISAKLALGFRISSWTGDISGGSSGAAVTLDSPRNAVLILDRVPAIAPSGVRNAALIGPSSAVSANVAPGSLISIFGANLAPDLAVGPTNPLVQTLESVTVRVDDTFLPLVFVSPGQINAQLPAGTSEGTHNLIVRWEGKPETPVQIPVTRNAPGLFITGTQEQPLGAFLRADGTAVNTDHPANGGETITALGTGLGPYVLQPPDGFLLYESSGYTLVDTSNVVIGDGTVLDVLYAGRSGAGVGVDAVRFQLPASLPDGPSVAFKIRVNGQESNTVYLPIAH